MTADAARAAIVSVVAAIPAGTVISYGEIAERAGLPRRARLVARVLSQLPDGNGLPWHRVLRAGGHIAFAPGSADFCRQRELLLAEGCKVSASGRVSGQPAPARTLDAELWGSLFER
jgi:methylated-DNA-protein-cysteine methyltransferase-like protein